MASPSEERSGSKTWINLTATVISVFTLAVTVYFSYSTIVWSRRTAAAPYYGRLVKASHGMAYSVVNSKEDGNKELDLVSEDLSVLRLFMYERVWQDVQDAVNNLWKAINDPPMDKDSSHNGVLEKYKKVQILSNNLTDKTFHALKNSEPRWLPFFGTNE